MVWGCIGRTIYLTFIAVFFHFFLGVVNMTTGTDLQFLIIPLWIILVIINIAETAKVANNQPRRKIR